MRPFRRWFYCQVGSAAGLAIQSVAIAPLVLRWHGNGVELALLSLATFGPLLVLGVWAGALIDHHDRSRILTLTQALLCAQSLGLYLLIITGAANYPSLMAVALAGGLVGAVDTPARQVFVLDLVGEERLAGAVSLYEVVLNLARVVGPATGGVLLTVSGPSACVLANAISFIPPMLVLLANGPTGRPPRSGERPQMIAGLRYAGSDPLLRACLALAFAAGVLFNFGVLLPLLADRAFHLGVTGFGVLLAVFGAGALPGALLAARLSRRVSGRQIRVLAVLTGLSALSAGVAPDRAWLYVGLLATGATSIWMISATNTLIQLATAPAFRGRVMGAFSAILPGSVPVTGLMIGAVADLWGARLAYATAGLLVAATALLCWRSFGIDHRA